MTQEEKKIVLKECDEKLAEINLKKKQAENAWESNYNSKYRVRFTIGDFVDKVVTTKIGGGILIISGAAIYALSHSWALSIGVPAGAVVGDVALMAINCKKKMEYWQELGCHEKVKSGLEAEEYPYKIVSDYLKDGKKYLLHQYRRNLASSVVPVDEEADELDYLDIDTEGLSPLMIKALVEMKSETIELASEMKTSILNDINAMHTRIIESVASVSFLEEYQKVLKKYAPPVEETTLTSE